MKIISSSPYAIFNSKEWNSLVSKNDRFKNTPIKVQKKFFKTIISKENEKALIVAEKNELHKQMQLFSA